MMKSILVIGIGRFGKHLSKKLLELGNEVMVVDQHEEALKDLLPIATGAQVGDCTQREVLRSLGVRNYDICFVCIGSDFQSSLVVTDLLRELGAKRIISKASRSIQANLLLRNGANEVVYPERDIAEKIAFRCSAQNLYDYFELSPEASIYEIPPMHQWLGKTIKEVNVRVKYHISILATKNGMEVAPLPPADHVFNKEEHLIVLGSRTDVEKILRHID